MNDIKKILIDIKEVLLGIKEELSRENDLKELELNIKSETEYKIEHPFNKTRKKSNNE